MSRRALPARLSSALELWPKAAEPSRVPRHPEPRRLLHDSGYRRQRLSCRAYIRERPFPRVLSRRRPGRCAGSVKDATFLAGDAYVAAGLTILAKARSRDRVLLRAYSFDAPGVLEGLEAASARGAACCLIADASQCHNTKSQWQALRRVASAGVSVRLATSRDYVQDGRGPLVAAA